MPARLSDMTHNTKEVDRKMQSLTQPRMFGAAGLLLLAAGLLWGAFKHEKPERLPPGWQPVNDRLAVSASDDAAGGEAGPPTAGQTGEGKAEPAGGPDETAADLNEAAAADRPDEAGAEHAAVAPAGSAGFDINRATAAEWDELPGIGPAKAQAIVEDRERNGPFRSIDDLARVKGIGPKLLERLREAIEARQHATGG